MTGLIPVRKYAQKSFPTHFAAVARRPVYVANSLHQ